MFLSRRSSPQNVSSSQLPSSRETIFSVYRRRSTASVDVYKRQLLDWLVVDLSTQIRSEVEAELLKRTPSSFLGSCRYKLPEIGENDEIYETIFARLAELDIGYFIYIGGNDSMDTIEKMSAYARMTGSDLCCIGVPKTIEMCIRDSLCALVDEIVNAVLDLPHFAARPAPVAGRVHDCLLYTSRCV